jgi:hypothetical protein
MWPMCTLMTSIVGLESSGSRPCDTIFLPFIPSKIWSAGSGIYQNQVCLGSTSCGPLFHLLWAIIPVKLSTLGFTLHVTPLVDHPPIFTCDLLLGLNCLIWLPISYVFCSAFADVVKNKLGKYLIEKQSYLESHPAFGP